MYEAFVQYFKIPSNDKLEDIDCNNCLMAQKGIYLPHLKCCTFHPYIPNYAVGAILKEKGEGANLIIEKLCKREFVLPLGVIPSWNYRIEHEFTSTTQYGRVDQLLCPFFNINEKTCHIWKYRSSSCRSYYCESKWGKKGLEYWEKYLDAFYFMEMALAQDFMLEQGFDWIEIEEQLDTLKEGVNTLQEGRRVLTEELHEKYWQHLLGHELEFFDFCYSNFKNFNRHDFTKVLGVQGLAFFAELGSWGPS
ncbi:MAG: hypothetical protein KDD40_09730 [Bdellovibrionales bacterium]|nr:hypothetical protein [Bdellovibrionales bacterium]